MSKKAITMIALLGLILVFAVGLRLKYRSSKQVHISEPIKRGNILESVYGIGTVVATRSFQLRSGVPNTIRKLYFREGDQVKAGERLVDLAETTRFMAPFDGTITYLPVKVGEAIFPQSLILNLVDLSDRYMTVSLEQRAAIKVKTGLKARISFDNMREQNFEGSVQSVYSNDNNFLVRIGVSQLPNQVLPGMTGDVSIGIREKNNVLLLPVAALDKSSVHVKRGAANPYPIEVKTGIIDGAWAELLEGDIREGDQLVILDKLTP